MRGFGLLVTASLMASLAALFALPSRAGSPVPVDVELVLAVDISYSMDYDELTLQREGYIQALTSKDFVDALRNGAHGKIAVIYIEWAGSHEQTIVVPWTLIENAATAQAFADKLAAAQIRRTYRTSISSALLFSAAQFGTSDFKGVRRVIDVSGDGTNNQGPLIEPTRDEIVAKGIVINGLPLQLKAPTGSMLDIPNLHEYYEDCVIGGTGSFVIPVRERSQFVNAVRQKLILEVSGIKPNGFTMQTIPAVKPPRVSCTIGESMWMQRWGN
ncbi:MAG: DUF1194 domain-containing protein [Xanthobacteraceae bacterium]|nr:DUF1194 domain-containing protein [Xanthobacteraceae bacterium]QYK45604.1 MAG: DUF1194 domain-containing protein [Xanthobacteraceae bacterium]